MSIGEAARDSLRNALGQILQVCVARIGPLPDDCGEAVREALCSGEASRMIAFGLTLEDCREHGSYVPLEAAIRRRAGEASC